MRIAVMMLNRGRGSGVVARQHVRALVEAGHKVTLLYPLMGDGVAGASNCNVPLHSDVLPVHEYLPVGAIRQRQVAEMSAGEAFAYTADYEEALWEATERADLIVGHHANISAIAVDRVARRRNIPFVLFVHGTGIEPMYRGGYAPAVWTEVDAAVRRAAGVIVTTPYVRDQLVRPVVPVPADRFLVLPCGVDLDELTPDGADDVCGRFELPASYVVSPGAVTWLKGTHNVVAASEHYADLAPTVFVGEGELRPQLEQRLGHRGRFVGFVSDADKAALINGAAIVAAAPEKQEHFGIIYVEGLAAGAVPVAYRGGGVDTIVTPDVGILTERTPAALGEAIRKLLLDPPRRSALAKAGRVKAAATFDRRNLGAKLVAWLETLAERRPVEESPVPAALRRGVCTR